MYQGSSTIVKETAIASRASRSTGSFRERKDSEAATLVADEPNGPWVDQRKLAGAAFWAYVSGSCDACWITNA